MENLNRMIITGSSYVDKGSMVQFYEYIMANRLATAPECFEFWGLKVRRNMEDDDEEAMTDADDSY